MFQPNLLQGKTILVTGGATGLGLAMSQRFSELGANVTIAARNVDRAQEVAKKMAAETGSPVLAVRANIRDPKECDNAVAQTVARFGQVDGLMNNAAGNFMCATEDVSPNGLSAVIDTVLKGSFFMTQSVGRHMIEAKIRGSIVSILTTYMWTGSSFVVPSAMAKAGLLAMTRSLAVEWGTEYGIRTNAISPGPFPTEGAWDALMPDASAEEEYKKHVPLGRFGVPSELGDLAAFLMADGSGFINGENITIDGGRWLQGAGDFNVMARMDRDNMKQIFSAMKSRRA